MGVSFKVSKTGTRFRPKPPQFDTALEGDVDDSSKASAYILAKTESTLKSAAKLSVFPDNIADGDTALAGTSDDEVSFSLNLFLNGYSIAKVSEKENGHLTTLQDVPKFLHPYDRTSETLFSAIESGKLPADILDDIPCKYFDGTLLCEVRDYRKCIFETGVDVSSLDGSPVVNKIRLKMSLENVVKDIPLISDSSWTYGDMMEMESRILKALQPQLCLNPTPQLERLCKKPVSSQLHLALCRLRRKRSRQMPEVTVTSNNNFHVKKICIDRVPESSNFRLGDAGPTSVNVLAQRPENNISATDVGPSNMLGLRPKSFVPDASLPALLPSVSHQANKFTAGVGSPRLTQDPGPGHRASAGQDMMISYADSMNGSISAVHGNKRDNQDHHLSTLSNVNKRARVTPVGADGSQQQQHIGPHMDSFHGSSDASWKSAHLPQQPAARGIQYGNAAIQKYSQQVFEGSLNQDAGAVPFSMRYAKEEPVETERLDKPEMNRMETDTYNMVDPQQPRIQQRISQQQQQSFIRSNFSQASWNNLGQTIENNNNKKDDQFQKRKLVQSPRVSAGGLSQSPLSSKSGEFSSGSIGNQFGGVATSSAPGSSQKEKSVVTSVPAGGTATSMTSSANDSIQRQHQAQAAARRRSNSLPKTAGAINGVGSPASVSNMSVPLNASSPPVGTAPAADQNVLERFSKIEMIAARHRLNCKKNKVDEYANKKIFPVHKLSDVLSEDPNNQKIRDETCTMPLSTSLLGGSMNVSKIRVLNIALAEHGQGNGFSVTPRIRTRMIMSEKPYDGTVAMHYGDIEDPDFLAAEDFLPTLPNTHTADLLAAQFFSLMTREGHHIEDHVQAKPAVRMHRVSSNNASSSVEMQQQYSEGAVPGQQSNEVPKPANSSGNNNNASLNSSSQNPQGNRMLPPGNAHQISQSLLPTRPQQQQQQQPDVQSSMQQQQQMLMQRSAQMLAANQFSHLNNMGQSSKAQMGNLINKPSPLQLQMLQQQQQQQQQPQMQRKMMMGLGGGLGNNMVGLGVGGMGNVLGMGSTNRTSAAPMGNVGQGQGQNSMNLSQASNISNMISHQLRSGTISQAQAHAALMATNMRVQNRPNMLGVVPQSSMGGIPGARQMHPGSTGLQMLGHTLNRANMNPMQQRTAIAPMGPPKMMTGMNHYMTQQQQQQLQLQQQQQQMQHQIQQQQLQQQMQQHQQIQQQESSSPLQAVVSPPQQVGSPSGMGIPQQQMNQQMQQQASPQQRTPMSPQLSSGGIHPMSGGNQDGGCPQSPQLSSQTLGSVGSITNSPMDMQGVNKS